MINKCSFFLSSLNMSESENFSDFKMSDEFMLLFYKKIEIDVHEILNSAISVQNFLIIVNRVWITSEIRVIEFMMYVILWLIKQKNNKEKNTI